MEESGISSAGRQLYRLTENIDFPGFFSKKCFRDFAHTLCKLVNLSITELMWACGKAPLSIAAFLMYFITFVSLLISFKRSHF